MSPGLIFFLCLAAAFPTLIIVATVVKLLEVRKAGGWPSTEGVVITSRIAARKKRPGESGYNFNDTEVVSQPLVEYEYQVDGRSLRSRRVMIGESFSPEEFDDVLARYPVREKVTVFYDPDHPENAVLERELPRHLWLGLGIILALFIGGPLVAAALYFGALDWLKPWVVNPGQVPFVAASSGFSLLSLLFAVAFELHVRRVSRWPVVQGEILQSAVETFTDRRRVGEPHSRPRKLKKASVVYGYEVNGRRYVGDRVRLGTVISSNLTSVARKTVDRYPPGKTVDVYYNPEAPSESVLQPRSGLRLLPWLMAAGMFTLSWAVARGHL